MLAGITVLWTAIEAFTHTYKGLWAKMEGCKRTLGKYDSQRGQDTCRPRGQCDRYAKVPTTAAAKLNERMCWHCPETVTCDILWNSKGKHRTKPRQPQYASAIGRLDGRLPSRHTGTLV